MATDKGEVIVLTLAESLELYYQLLELSKEMGGQLSVLRGRILQSLSSMNVDQIQADGFEVTRQLRHHPPRLNEEWAEQILQDHGRLEECQEKVLDDAKARQVIDEMFRRGEISRDDLPYIYVTPTEALVVRPIEGPAEAEEEERPERRRAA